MSEFYDDLSRLINRRAITVAEKDYTFDPGMSEETKQAGVYANSSQPGVTARLWAYWMCGANVIEQKDSVLIVCQNRFFRDYARQELGLLLERAYKKPVWFKIRGEGSISNGVKF